MSWTIPAVCPLKGNNSWVVRPLIAESTSSRRRSASLLASWVRPDHSLTKGVRSTRGTVAYAPPPVGGKIPSQASNLTTSSDSLWSIVRFHPSSAEASSEARKRVPTLAPWAPSTSAAASPRPSATPPAANTGMGSTASATWGKSAMAPTPRATPCPPASEPWAMITSTPNSAALRAWPTVYLVDHLRPCIMRSLNEVSRVPEGERDDRWLRLEGDSEGCFVEQRYHMVDREGSRSDISHAAYLPLDALGRFEDGADASKAASLTDRSDQFWVCCGPDRRLHDGDLHSQQVAYWRSQHGSPSRTSGRPRGIPFHR